MRLPLLSLAMTLLGVGVGACGDAGSASHQASPAATARVVTSRSGTAAVGAAALAGRYANDADNDRSNDNDPDDQNGSTVDNDNDYREDNLNPGNDLYQDTDDASVASFGSPADAADTRAVTALVKRYHAVAAARDGAAMCAMMPSSFASSIPEDYGHGSVGPAYLSSARTCRSTMTLLLAHFHSRFVSPFTVTGVRVKGDEAYALLGSRTAPASYVLMKRDHGAWTIDMLLAGPLP